jgi:hypothetical protein
LRTGKWPIEIDGLPFLKMVIFYSYVSLPEGTLEKMGMVGKNGEQIGRMVF